MGVNIPNEARFLGVPLVKVRNVLKAWRYGTSADAADIAKLANVGLDVRTVMMLLDELRDRGLIGEEKTESGGSIDGLTEKGHALAIADARTRTPQKAAWKKFDDFLVSCAAVNDRSELPFYVKKVWLFGSMIDPAQVDVGDIDFVVETGRRADASKSRKIYKRLAKGLRINTDSWDGYWKLDFLVEKRLLYGPRRHPLLKPSPLRDLQALACPCQLVFTECHGRAMGPILEKHPSATEKKDTVRNRFVLTDLFGESTALRPLPVDLVDLRRLYYDLLAQTGPWPGDDSRYRIVQDVISDSFPISSNKLPKTIASNVVTERLDISQCDSRSRSGLLVTERLYIDPKTKRRLQLWRARIEDKDGYWRWETICRATYGVVVERSIQEQPDTVTYSVSVLNEVFKTRVENPSQVITSDSHVVHCWLYLLATADLERIWLRDAERGASRQVVVSVTSTKESYLVNDLARSLSEFVRQASENAT
jgi:predicted nucleotidyltransferase